MSERNDLHSRMYQRIEALTRIDGPHGWIQWKGTNVCMDLHCACGAHLHADEEFFYSVRCGHCGVTYAVSPFVKLVPLTPEEAAWHGDQTVELRDGEQESGK